MRKPQNFGFEEPLVFERSRPGRTGFSLPPIDVEEIDPAEALPAGSVRDGIPGFPELTEPDVVRHYTRLSSWNFSIDNAFYPLGSCTMKHNPRVNEATARLPGFTQGHPLAHPRRMQGSLALMHSLGRMLTELTGMDQVSLQPAAGAQGELTGLMMIRALLESRGDARTHVMIPDSAHGTNPATTAICGYRVIRIPSTRSGSMDIAAVQKRMGPDVAAIMITNPNTLGLFEENITDICELAHKAGAMVYGDGANLNALLGHCRPGDLGIDVLHINLHKTFTTPHGGGGPGSGPVVFKKVLEPFMPAPVVRRKNGSFDLDSDRPQSIGRVHTFLGNFGMYVRAYTYIRELGAEGLTRVSELAVLNANYLRARLEDTYHLPYKRTSMHEVVFTDKNLRKNGVKTMDVAKRLIDHGFHPPTVYFPLVVDGALMIEPTETESKETLDRFADTLVTIAKEAQENPETLHEAPHHAYRGRLDEVRAAKSLKLRWEPEPQ